MMPLVIAVISLIAAKKKRDNDKAAQHTVIQQVSVAPAGWYTCPWDNTMLRWWDGTQWTHHAAYLQQVPQITN